MTTSTRTPASLRRQIRSFALVWTGVTILMGACTFAAIYMAYGFVNPPEASSFALPTQTPDQAAAAPTQTVTTPPTITPAPTDPPTEAPTEAVAEPAQAMATPTLLPVDDQTYHVGIQVQYALSMNPDEQRNWMREVNEKLHMDWYKQQVRWEDVEPERGQYDWSKLDLALPIAAEEGVKVLISVVTAPEWAREAGVDLSEHGPPANFSDFANFITTLLRRYPGMVHAVEVWNEQNLDREWTSVNGLSASNYVAMLREVYTAIKNTDPGVIVVSGALSPTGGWTEPDGRVSAIDDFVYMDQMIAAGMLNYTDCVGAHHNGYNIGPSVPWNNVPPDPSATFTGPFNNPHHSWSFYSTLRTYADKIRTAGSDLKLCVTEFGWASTEDLGGSPPGFAFADDNTLEEQAEWTVEAMQIMEDWGTVWLAFVWNLNYGPQAGWDTQNDNVPYSIIGKDWNFRPAHGAIAEWQRARRAGGAS